MARRLVSRSEHLSSPQSSSGRKAKSSVRASGRKVKRTTSRVASVSGRKAEPVSPAAASAEDSSLGRLLCLRCAKRGKDEPKLRCTFDDPGSKKCSRCRSQKSICPPVSTSFSSSVFVLTLVVPLPTGPVWPNAAPAPTGAGRLCLGLWPKGPSGRNPSGLGPD
jgi:hypothetical protein